MVADAPKLFTESFSERKYLIVSWIFNNVCELQNFVLKNTKLIPNDHPNPIEICDILSVNVRDPSALGPSHNKNSILKGDENDLLFGSWLN